LEDGPLVIDDFAVVGTMGWYDYSFRDPSLGISEDSYKAKFAPTINGACWADAKFVRWDYSDKEMTDLLAAKLNEHLGELKAANKILVVTHHLVTQKLLHSPRLLVPKTWRFLNAFLGSQKLYEVISGYKAVTDVVSGHIHMNRDKRINGQRFLTIGSSYTSKQLLSLAGDQIQRQNFP